MFQQLEESENQTITVSLLLSELLLLIVSKISMMVMSVQNVDYSISKKLETSKPFFPPMSFF